VDRRRLRTPVNRLWIRREKFQTIHGFGTGIGESSAFNYAQMDSESKSELIEMLFGKTGLKLVWAREIIGETTSQTNLSHWLVREGDMTLESFSIAPDEKYVIPFARAVLKKVPHLRIYGSPVTPPLYMKTKQALAGGHLRPEMRPLYAKYITKWVEAWKAAGIKIWGLTVQNEPTYSAPYGGCIYTGPEEGHFVAENLRPTLDAAGLKDVNVMIWDEVRVGMKAHVDAAFAVPGARAATWGVACHWYQHGHWDQADAVHEAYDCPQVMTEMSLINRTRHAKTPWRDGVNYAAEFIGGLNHWMTGFVECQCVQDKNGGPRIHAPYKMWVAVGWEDGKLVKHETYWSWYHLSHFIESDAVRVGCAAPAGVLATAAQNPDGSVVVVVLNEGAKEKVVVAIGGQFVELKLAKDSLQTIVLK
jgi:glucosylceramidase